MYREISWPRRAVRFGAIFLLLLVPLALIPILAGWIGDVAKEWFTERAAVSTRDLWLMGLSLIGLLGLAAVVVLNGRKLLPARILDQTRSHSPRKVVVALLSPCHNLQRSEAGEWEVRLEHDKTAPWVSLAGKTIGQLTRIDPAIPMWKWQQTLRAANYHRGHLQKLVLVGSKGDGGSGAQKQLKLAEEFLSKWFPGKVAIYGAPTQPGLSFDDSWQADFENLSELLNLLRRILRELRLDPSGFTDRDIVIDCTGGFKVASIAAALVTLDRPSLMFQYVGTGEHADQVIGFDVANEYYGAS
jgi:hypothetical protein